MKKLLIIPVLAFALAACSNSGGSGKADLKTNIDTVSYKIGFDMGKNLRQQKVEGVNTDAFMAGLITGLKSDTAQLTQEQMSAAEATFITKLNEKRTADMKKAGEEMKAKCEKFLAENKGKPGVITTASGLQYKVIKEGTGPLPKATEAVVVNYRGTLIDGKEFDSSIKRGQPAKFPVSGVIPGFTEVLQLMKVGSKWEVYIPANLAYGPQGAGDMIPPNSMLIFELELLGIQPVDAPQQQPH